MSIVNRRCATFMLGLAAFTLLGAPLASQERPPQRKLRVDPPHITTDKSVKYDYDIVYVRAPRFVSGKDGKDRPAEVWPDAGTPHSLRAATDLMLLHPDGAEEVLVAGDQGAIADPYVSFDAKWVYYTYFHDHTGHGGADIYKVHVPTRKIVRLTHQQWTPNTEAGVKTAVAKGEKKGVYNIHPCPLPGGRLAFVSTATPSRPRAMPKARCNSSSWTTPTAASGTSKRSASSTSVRHCTPSY